MADQEREEFDRLRRELASGEEPGAAGHRGAVGAEGRARRRAQSAILKEDF